MMYVQWLVWPQQTFYNEIHQCHQPPTESICSQFITGAISVFSKICSNLGLERIFLSLSQFMQFCLTRDSNCVSVDSKKLKLKSDSPLSQRKTLHVKICISCSLSGPVEVRSQVQVQCVAGVAWRGWMFSDLHE